MIARAWDGPHIVDWGALLRDFSDTAALIEHLDLIISVDTSTAHLAGAMGKPVWLLNRFDTCWRWLLDRSDSPWYPTLRVYRQERAGDWDSVLRRVRMDLGHLAAAPPFHELVIKPQ
jgi:ADP-heptose:LPS heptosyltransferase